MRVLYLTRDYTPHDYRFVASLNERGYEVAYVRLEKGAVQREQRRLPDNVESVNWAGGTRPMLVRDWPRLLASLRGVINRVQPDLIHAGPIQSAALLAALTRFRPLVTMSWGSDLLVSSEQSPFNRWATRHVLARSDVLVGDCAAVRRKALDFGMSSERIVTFPWGVDLEHFKPNGIRPGYSQSLTLLSTRSWEPIHGVDVVARAFALLARDRSDVQLILLGTGSMEHEIRGILVEAGVTDRVTCPGQVSYEDLPDYYGRADVYLSASHSDGTSISLLEALACGRPVLVSDIPGNREWVRSGVHGWYFPDDNAEALASGALRILEEPKTLSAIGAAARELAEARSNWSENFELLLHAYRLACDAY